MMFYIKTSSGEFIETQITPKKLAHLSRDVKVFRLSNNQVIKTNNFTFYEIIKSLPEGSISGEVVWDYKDKDVTDVLVY